VSPSDIDLSPEESATGAAPPEPAAGTSFEEAAAALLGEGEAVPEPTGEGGTQPEEMSPFAAALAAALRKAEEPEPEPEVEAEVEAEAEVEQAEAEAAVDEPGDEAPGDESPVAVFAPASPYDLPGSWFVVHSYSGYENKVKANLETRIRSMHMEEAIFDVVIPMEDVVEFKGGRKVTVPKKQFPGYLLVRMYLDEESWSVVRNTPGVTGFVGSASRPTPLSRREVERILGVRKDDEVKKAPRFKPDWEVGETVRVVEGPFADFNGVIEDINVDQSKVRVLVDIFGRETPVELNFEQIQKF
jgi:transcriptional antiterminator NusG